MRFALTIFVQMIIVIVVCSLAAAKEQRSMYDRGLQRNVQVSGPKQPQSQRQDNPQPQRVLPAVGKVRFYLKIRLENRQISI